MTEAVITSLAMGVLGILAEALKISLRNGKLMFFISLLLLVPSSLLLLGNHFILNPLVKDLVLNEFSLLGKVPGSSEYINILAGIRQVIRILVAELTISFLISYLTSLFSLVAMIYSAAASYSGNNLSLKELVTMMKRSWKRPVITFLYITLFNIGCSTILVVLIVVLEVAAKGSVAFTASGVLITLLLFLLFVYLGVVWVLSIVVSVVEEDCYGLGALGKAGELIKGRKLQGFALFLLMELVFMPIIVFSGLKMGDLKVTEVRRLAISLAFLIAVHLKQLFTFVVCTAFYFECKESHGEEIEIQIGSGYSLASTGLHVDASLP